MAYNVRTGEGNGLDIPAISMLIEEKGWSISEFSEVSGISYRALYYYLRGQRSPNLGNACILADTLGVGLDDIVLTKDDEVSHGC